MGDGYKTNYVIEDIYQGGFSSLNPDYGSAFPGYHEAIKNIGVSTDPRTANILKEVSDKIAPGQKIIELSLIDLGAPLDTITKQQMEEVRRLSKLTGVELTVHGPITDASGITEQGGFDDTQREMVERKLINSIERANEVNENGNISVTFHTSNRLPGPIWGKSKDKKEEIEAMPIVNQETGQLNIVRKDEKFRPYGYDEKKGELIPGVTLEKYGVKRQLNIMNDTQWDRELQELIVPKEHADRILRETAPLAQAIMKDIQQGKEIDGTKREIISRFQNAHEQLRDIHSHLNSVFSKGYKYGDEKTKKYFEEVAKQFGDQIKKTGGNALAESHAVQNLMESMRMDSLRHNKLETPQIFKPAEEYALEKTALSYGNVAFASYDKFGKKAPIINIENPPAGGGLSRGEDVKNVVEKAREVFANKMMEEKKMSKKNANELAEKMIGVTWDVGHINQLRKYGFEGKDVVKEAEKVKHLVKHIHLSDNFGMDNIEMPMGMGNVDLKAVMEKLGKRGKEAKKIIEAAHWWQFNQSSPVGPTFEMLGSPLYSSGMGPYINQVAGFQQGYFGGYGTSFPQINYETFGAGFSTLPTELGGQRQGGRGRMSGNPME